MLALPDYDSVFEPQNYRPTTVNDVVNSIIAARASAVIQRLPIVGTVSHDLTPGRLLRHNFGETTCTAVPKGLTSGFIDSYDIPPWDLWVAFVKDLEFPSDEVEYLVCWVPEPLVESVDKAVRTSFEENLLWLDETHSELTHALRSEFQAMSPGDHPRWDFKT